MINFLRKFREDSNFILLFLAVLFLLLAILNPSVPITKNIYNYIFIVDISQSMNTPDMSLDAQKISRIEYSKKTLQRLVERLPCKTKVSIGMFCRCKCCLHLHTHRGL